MKRRGFLKLLGLGVPGAVLASKVTAEPLADVPVKIGRKDLVYNLPEGTQWKGIAGVDTFYTDYYYLTDNTHRLTREEGWELVPDLDLSKGLAKANEVNAKFYEHAFKWKK